MKPKLRTVLQFSLLLLAGISGGAVAVEIGKDRAAAFAVGSALTFLALRGAR